MSSRSTQKPRGLILTLAFIESNSQHVRGIRNFIGFTVQKIRNNQSPFLIIINHHLAIPKAGRKSIYYNCL